VPTVNAVESNETIHDFGGFPRALYDLRYPAPGSPTFAARIVERLRTSGFDCNIDKRRGLDHGAWVPLLLMYPRADIPVLQLSAQPHLGPEHHLRVQQSEVGSTERKPFRGYCCHLARRPSQIVEIVEPLFSNLNAAIELVPVMNGDDLRKGIAKATQMTELPLLQGLN